MKEVNKMSKVNTIWGKHKVGLDWVPASEIPENATPMTSHGICFFENKVMLVKVDNRGWDIPGGHIEAGETPEDGLFREIMEEAAVSGSALLLGFVAVDNSQDEFWDSNKYPITGYQAYYRVDIDEIHPFVREFEVSERATVDLDEVSQLHHNWNAVYQEILDAAIDRP